MVDSNDRYWVRLDRDVITVGGPEAEPFLQGQLSQDVTSLPAGGSAWSWLLAPTGKVDALVRVSRGAGGVLVLDTDGGWGEAVLARLTRFKLRTKADLEQVPAAVIGLRGPGWDLVEAGVGASIVAVPPWPGLAGADVIHLDGQGAGFQPPAGVPEMTEAEYESVRISAGQPRMGAELSERTIPGETGLIPFTVSFTKGCYTGQELVARIDSRGGNVARHLRRLIFGAGTAAGTELYEADPAEGDRPVGTVTSVAADGPGRWVGLGYVRRGIEPPCTLSAGPGGPAAPAGAAVEMEALPW